MAGHVTGQFFSNFFQFFFFAYFNSGYVCTHETYNIYVSKQLFRCVFHVYFTHLHAPAKGVGGAWRPEPYGAGHFLDPWDRVDHRPSWHSERRSVWASGSRAVTPNAFPMGVPIIRESHADHCSQDGYTYIDSIVHWDVGWVEGLKPHWVSNPGLLSDAWPHAFEVPMAYTHIHMHKYGHMKIYVFFQNFLPVCYCRYF